MKASRFTQVDVARVIRAVRQCGANMEIVITSDGEIRIVSMGTATAPGKGLSNILSVKFNRRLEGFDPVSC